MRGLFVALAVVLSVIAGCRRSPPNGGRILILGFDGLDFAVTRDLMAQGRMPNFSRVAAQGGFSPLGTSVPPQSPVAWSTFITGTDPHTHGIFDFIHRDPTTMVPYLSTTRTQPASYTLRLGPWQLPLSPPWIESLRRGLPFWKGLEDRGIHTTVIRMPANFPPSGMATKELSGMDTPDIIGTYGQFTFFTSDPTWRRQRDVGGGTIQFVDTSTGKVEGVLQGPQQPFLTNGAKMEVHFVAHVDATRRYVLIEIGGETRLVAVGDWSDWVPVAFAVTPGQTLRAEARFYLKQIDPYFALYVTPLNLDPLAPALPISTPPAYAADVARATGRFYTQGMPEETKALKAGIFSRDEFLRQARTAQRENRRQFHYVLDHFDHGLLFYYFGNLDQVSHILWRTRDPQHPAYNAVLDAPYAQVIDDLYVELDDIVGEALERLAPDDLLVVMSDHGFASWRRSFNLNAWLRNQGYVTPSSRAGGPALGDVSLSASSAYGLGLNGLYLNLEGREAFGIVQPEQRDALLQEITAKLLSIIDPETGQPAITKVFRGNEVPSDEGNDAVGPDLILGYANGTRVSDESALGVMTTTVFADNTSEWSGDHCMDPDAVPGVLLTSRALGTRVMTLQTLAPAILAEFGVKFPDR